MPAQQVIEVAAAAHQQGATEVHIVGGLHPWLKFDYYLSILRGIRQSCPGLHIKAFTAVEIVHLSRIAGLPVREVLLALQEAGLGSMPGGGAEIFDDRVHDAVFKGKVRADRWFEVHRTAHELGIYTNATMLYGHVETPAERVAHLIKLRELQDESLARIAAARLEIAKAGAPPAQRGGPASEAESAALTPRAQRLPAAFNCMVPLSFAPENSELGDLPGPTGLTDLKTLAIARLMLDNIPHLKAFWIMTGIHVAQIALSWGCDDLDGTVRWYDITKPAGSDTHQEMTVAQLHRLIGEAGLEPVERDTLYHPISADPAPIGL
jgi:aminodeoxyfutalosine synthase